MRETEKGGNREMPCTRSKKMFTSKEDKSRECWSEVVKSSQKK